jgi:HAD superfamily hydrolase (TIGR01509 family)
MSNAGPDTRSGFDAAVFDMDGLLVDSEPLWHEAELRIFHRYGVPLTVERCRETTGMFLGDVVRHWRARYAWDGPAVDVVAGQITDAMDELLRSRATLKPGAVHALAFCRARGLRLALASSSPRRLIDTAIGHLRLTAWFAVVHSDEGERAGKPDPAVFVSTAALLGVDPTRCLAFEDSPAGVRAAVAAGMTCVAVPEAHTETHTGPHAGAGAFEAAALVIASLDDLDDDVWRRLTDRSRRTASPSTVRRTGSA